MKKSSKNMAKLGWKRFTFSAEKKRKNMAKLGWKRFIFSAEIWRQNPAKFGVKFSKFKFRKRGRIWLFFGQIQPFLHIFLQKLTSKSCQIWLQNFEKFS
jgi:hypothetical protein